MTVVYSIWRGNRTINELCNNEVVVTILATGLQVRNYLMPLNTERIDQTVSTVPLEINLLLAFTCK